MTTMKMTNSFRQHGKMAFYILRPCDFVSTKYVWQWWRGWHNEFVLTMRNIDVFGCDDPAARGALWGYRCRTIAQIRPLLGDEPKGHDIKYWELLHYSDAALPDSSIYTGSDIPQFPDTWIPQP